MFERKGELTEKDKLLRRIKGTLTKKEIILSYYISNDGTYWFATTKRIIKYRKGNNIEKIDELPYRHITSLNLTFIKRNTTGLGPVGQKDGKTNSPK